MERGLYPPPTPEVDIYRLDQGTDSPDVSSLSGSVQMRSVGHFKWSACKRTVWGNVFFYNRHGLLATGGVRTPVLDVLCAWLYDSDNHVHRAPLFRVQVYSKYFFK